MIVSIARDTLLDAVACARKAVPSKDSLPILKNLALTASESGLDLIGTDLDLMVKVRVTTCDSRRPGSICVPAELLAKILAELPSGDVVLEATNYLLHISLEGAAFRSKIAGVDISEFPDGWSVDGAIASTDKDTILRLISGVGFCASRDTTRLALNGICLTRNRRHAHAVATDGHRLARLTAHAFRFEGEPSDLGEWIIPTSALKALAGMCGDAISIRLAQDAISMASSPSEGMSCEVVSKLVSGPYPNWKQVIRSTSPHQATFCRDELHSALRRAMAVAKGPAPKIFVRPSGSGAGAVIASIGPEGRLREGTEIIAAQYLTPEPMPEWSCNPVYLEELIALCPTRDVRLEFGPDQRNAIHVVPCSDQPDQFFLLMPLRIDTKPVTAEAA